jgi:hypothetical protein
VKTFGDKKNLQKGMFVLNQSVIFEQQDFHSNLKNPNISVKEYKAYLVDLEEKEFQSRWDYMMYYNINNLIIMISPIDNLIAIFFK